MMSSAFDQEPQFLSWTFQTWEHAVLTPGSLGEAKRLRDSKRLLPNEITEPIYSALAEVERSILRLTEPIPPFEARLLRVGRVGTSPETEGEHMALSMPWAALEKQTFSKTIEEIIPGWDVKLADVLGSDFNMIEKSIRNFYHLGIPRGKFSVFYGYRLNHLVIDSHASNLKQNTLRSLLMGCQENTFQPGCLRDAIDKLLQ